MKKICRAWQERNFFLKVICWSLAAGVLFILLICPFLQNSFVFKRLKQNLSAKLCKSVPLPSDFGKNGYQGKAFIYVMGGSQSELTDRFQTAAELYRYLKPIEILILNVPGITRYEPSLHRNLTNSEWASKELIGLGIGKMSIHFISCTSTFFGTFSEAKCVSDCAFNGSYRDLIVVSSPYHTMRAWLSFDRFLQRSGVRCYIYPSKKDTNLKYLIIEGAKLFIYKYLLIPIDFRSLKSMRAGCLLEGGRNLGALIGSLGYKYASVCRDRLRRNSGDLSVVACGADHLADSLDLNPER